MNGNNTDFDSQLYSSSSTALEATFEYDIPEVSPRLELIERLSMTFTANGKRQKRNFCRLSSDLCTVESKYLYLL